MLAEAGYPQGIGFQAIEAWGTLSITDQFFRYLQAQWRDHLSVEVVWQKFERNEYDERFLAHTPHLFTFGWRADYPDPDNFLRVGMHQQHVEWHNAQYEQLLDAARRVTDPVERLKLYQAADRLLMQEAGIMPLTYQQWHYLIKPWVKKYPISALAATYWKDVIIEAH